MHSRIKGANYEYLLKLKTNTNKPQMISKHFSEIGEEEAAGIFSFTATRTLFFSS